MSQNRSADPRTLCADLIARALEAAWPNAGHTAIAVDRPKDPGHGDYACSVALQLARTLKRKPRDIATAIVAALPSSPYIERAEVAGAGFINLFLRASFRQQVVNEVLGQGNAY